VDKALPTLDDSSLDVLRDCAVLLRAKKSLLLQSQDKSLDVFFRACISAMVGVLNLFLDPGLSYIWREASMIITKA